MSITVTVNGFAQVPDGMLVVPTSKLALIRWGLVCGRPWWISDPRYGRWTEWDAPPPDIGEVAGSELLELRRVICLLGAFLHEDRIGAPIETTDHFHALHGAGLEEAASRLDAAVAGQLAWSLLDVAALHHVGWTGPSLGISPDPGSRRPDYAGIDGEEPARWVVLTAAAQAHSADVPPVDSIAQRGVSAWGAVVALPGEDAGVLDAYLEQPDTTAEGGVLEDLDPDLLHEQRYARFAWALAAGLIPRVIEVAAPAAVPATLHLFRLGVTGYVGVTAEIAAAISAALAGPVDGRRRRFADEVRAAQRARAAAERRVGPPRALPLPTRRKARVAGPCVTTVDGITHDVSIGPDGIALMLPSTIVRPSTDAADHVADAA